MLHLRRIYSKKQKCTYVPHVKHLWLSWAVLNFLESKGSCPRCREYSVGLDWLEHQGALIYIYIAARRTKVYGSAARDTATTVGSIPTRWEEGELEMLLSFWQLCIFIKAESILTLIWYVVVWGCLLRRGRKGGRGLLCTGTWWKCSLCFV